MLYVFIVIEYIFDVEEVIICFGQIRTFRATKIIISAVRVIVSQDRDFLENNLIHL